MCRSLSGDGAAGRASIRIRTTPLLAASRSVSSTGTTVSAPGGRKAPVMIRTAVPEASGVVQGVPGKLFPITRKEFDSEAIGRRARA
jgi:hypothetical protein